LIVAVLRMLGRSGIIPKGPQKAWSGHFAPERLDTLIQIDATEIHVSVASLC